VPTGTKRMNRNIQVGVKPEDLKATKIKTTVCYDVLPCRLVATSYSLESSMFLQNSDANLTCYMTLPLNIYRN